MLLANSCWSPSTLASKKQAAYFHSHEEMNSANNLEAHPFLIEPPNENTAPANALTAAFETLREYPGKPYPDSLHHLLMLVSVPLLLSFIPNVN